MSSRHGTCSSDLEYQLDKGRANVEMKTLKEKEKEHLQEVLEITHWDLDKASRLLTLTLKQVKKKISEHGIEVKEPDTGRETMT